MISDVFPSAQRGTDINAAGPGGVVLTRTIAVFGLFVIAAVFAAQGMSGAPSEPARRSRSVEQLATVLPDEEASPPTIMKQPSETTLVSKGFGLFAALTGGAVELSERDRAEAEDKDEMLRFGGARVKRGVVDSIRRGADRARVDPVMLMAIADKESAFATDVKASTSSATGLFQFIESTWLRAIREFGPRYGLDADAALVEGADEKPFVADAAERARILDMRTYPYLSALMAAECLKSARLRLANVVGREPTVGETYLTHFLGSQSAELFMQKLVAQPKVAAASVFKAPARANKPIFYAGKRGKALTIANVHEKFEDMMDTRVRRYAKLGEQTRALAYSQ